MSLLAKSRVAIKIFLGYPLQSAHKILLDQNREWKLAILTPNKESVATIRYKDKDYIGRYLDGASYPLPLIKKAAHEIQQEVSQFLPELDADSHPLILFPQVFVK